MRTTYTSEVFIAYFITLFSLGFLTPLFTILASTATIMLAIYGFIRGQRSSKREKEREEREKEREEREKEREEREKEREEREKEQEKRNEIEHQNRIRIQELEIMRLENEIGIDADDLPKRLKDKDDNL